MAIGDKIQNNEKIFTVRATLRGTDSSPISTIDAFKTYGNSIIRYKDLDAFYRTKQPKENGKPLWEVHNSISRLMGAHSAKNDEIVPLGELDTENGRLYIERGCDGETSRMYLFTKEQARKNGINLNEPAFIAIEEGYKFEDIFLGGYAINIPEESLGMLFENNFGNLQSGNLRIFYGSFQSLQVRYVENEFFLPLKKVAEDFDPKHSNSFFDSHKNARHFYVVKPGPAITGIDGSILVNYYHPFTAIGGLFDQVAFGLLTEKTALQIQLNLMLRKTRVL